MYGLGKAINSCKFCSSVYHMNMTLIKVELLHNTFYKRVRERSAKRNFYFAFSHLFFFCFGCIM